MRFAPLDRHFTGISVPVAALRTASDCGVGEFSDLVSLGEWCRDAGLDLIQLLPINDTGTNSSPYSALSAFALHPLYLHLDDVPGAAKYAEEIGRFRADVERAARAAPRGRFSYAATLAFKLSIVERAYADNAAAVAADPGFVKWRGENPWVIPYAVFTGLKRESGNAPWSAWGDMADPSAARIAAWWDAHPALCLPAAWAQYLLETQLARASRALHAMGVFLKGDLPILMSRESVDVWAERSFFDLTGIAGAPPDMFSPDGQNWGFPVYDWESLGREDYRWWKDRLRQSGKFFHAFRIDHVLGFFRIWRIPRGEVTGLLGRFSPSAGFTRADLRAIGFDDGRLRWLSLPHVSGPEIAAAVGSDAGRVTESYLRRIGAEDLYNLAAPYDSESALRALSEPPAVKGFLLERHGDRTLLDDGAGLFFPAWYFETKKGFQSLSVEEKKKLKELADRRRQESEAAWESVGRRLLSVLQGATDMLVCAEDLGDVPRCVPRVLDNLGILGLRIVRWAREYEKAAAGQPAAFISPSRYPLLSVCTPSVHDTSTVRGWWEEDPVERELFFRSLGETGPCPPRATLPLLEKIMTHCGRARSLLCVFQVQDLLDLDENLWASDPKTDRINVPGTVTDENWTWRMPLLVGELSKRTALTARVRALCAARRLRPLEKGTP
ncbi:MAG: 4-alpha-glucanotransferase [Spirochaetia bacterium]